MSEIILKTVDLCRDFKTGSEIVHAIHNINIEVEKGSLTILKGRSGSGKTTLLNQLSALDTPTSGKVFFHNKDIVKIPEGSRDDYRRKSIGFAFQSLALISCLSAYENIEFALRIAGYPAKERKNRALECLAMVDLRKRINHRPGEMSGGEQQRVAIARAFSHTPELLFADEPTAALDTHTGLVIVNLIKGLVKEYGITVVMTTHDMNLMSIADRVYTLEDGEIVD